MKKVLLLFVILLFLACKKESKELIVATQTATEVQTPQELGKTIFEGKGNCVACHLVDKEVVGPSLQDIAKIYKEKNGDMLNFLKGEGEPIVDPSQYEVMKTNFAITKTMTDLELKALEAYVYSNLK